MDINRELSLLDNPTSPNDSCVSLVYGQPQYSFDINTSAFVAMATAVATLSIMTNVNPYQFQNFSPAYLQSDIPAIELYIDNADYRNLTVSEIVKRVLKFYSLGKTHLCAIAGISRPSLYAWLDNTSVPDEKNFSKIRTLYNIADNIAKTSGDTILWSILERPIKQLGMSLYDVFVKTSNLDTLEISNLVKESFDKSVAYKKNMENLTKTSFNNNHSVAEQELNLEDNI